MRRRRYWRVAYLLNLPDEGYCFGSLPADRFEGSPARFGVGRLGLLEADLPAYREAAQCWTRSELRDGRAVQLEVRLRHVVVDRAEPVARAKHQQVSGLSVPLICRGESGTGAVDMTAHRVRWPGDLRLRRIETGLLQPACSWHGGAASVTLSVVEAALGVPVREIELPAEFWPGR